MTQARPVHMSDELSHMAATSGDSDSGDSDRAKLRLPPFDGAGADFAHEFVKGELVQDSVPWKRVE